MNARKILGYALGPLGSAVIGIVSLPLISWYFPAEDIGRIVLLQTVSSLVLLLLGLGLDQAYIREYYAAPDKPALFKAVALAPTVLVALLFAGIALWKVEWPSEKILELNDVLLGALCLLFFFCTLLTRYLSLILRMQEKALAFSFSQLTPKILIMVLVVCYVLFGSPKNTLSLVAAYAFAQVLTVAVLAAQTSGELKSAAAAAWSPPLFKDSLRYGIPLAIGGLAYWGFTSVDRFLLKELGGLSELGIYSMAVSFGAIALIFQSIFSTIWAPMVFKWVNENTHLDKISGITCLMTDLIAGILCAVGIFSPLVAWILPEKYASVQFILLSSMLFPLLYTLTEVTGIGINVSKKTWLITIFSIAALICNMFLLYWLVPSLGARGAAMSTAISFWIFSVLKTEASVRLWQKLPRRQLYGTMLGCLLCCLAYTRWGNPGNYYYFAALWLFILAALYLKHKQRLQDAFRALRGRLKKFE